MQFHILGLFPDVLASYFSHSLLGAAAQKGVIQFLYHQLRDYALDKHHAVDDRPYGGGSGMVFLPEVVTRAVRDLKSKHSIKKVILTSPAGQLLTPQKARALSEEGDLLFLCARYEGVDQRAIDLVVDEEISIGDYVVSNGELACAVIIDAIARYVPGVIGKEAAAASDSHENGLLEHPHFTRPETFENITVPPVLMSGNHKEIDKWRRTESIRRTWRRRPELLKKANLTADELNFVKELIHKT